jgi:hypothetical protein
MNEMENRNGGKDTEKNVVRQAVAVSKGAAS